MRPYEGARQGGSYSHTVVFRMRDGSEGIPLALLSGQDGRTYLDILEDGDREGLPDDVSAKVSIWIRVRIDACSCPGKLVSLTIGLISFKIAGTTPGRSWQGAQLEQQSQSA